MSAEQSIARAFTEDREVIGERAAVSQLVQTYMVSPAFGDRGAWWLSDYITRTTCEARSEQLIADLRKITRGEKV